MKLDGKKVIALGERDGVPGPAIAECVRSAGADVVFVETVSFGDPAYVGPLAGVQLGLPVVHILEEDVKEQVDPAVYEEQVGLLEMTLDVDQVRHAAATFPGR